MTERCFRCDQETGRAGKADDSLYTPEGWGPFCEDCWDELTPDGRLVNP